MMNRTSIDRDCVCIDFPYALDQPREAKRDLAADGRVARESRGIDGATSPEGHRSGPSSVVAGGNGLKVRSI